MQQGVKVQIWALVGSLIIALGAFVAAVAFLSGCGKVEASPISPPKDTCTPCVLDLSLVKDYMGGLCPKGMLAQGMVQQNPLVIRCVEPKCKCGGCKKEVN